MRKSKNGKATPPSDPGPAAAKSPAPPAEPEAQVGTPPLVVGFGASAGGLEAFTDMLRHIPADAGLALVLVQHLDPKHSSMLTELLSRSTAMPVEQVREGTPVKAGSVYVIPPNTNLTVAGGTLHLAPRPPAGQHMPVDYFFRSLAQEYGDKAVGVVLSGTASDGTLGLKAIKAEGGITFAESPESARFDGMPRSAMSAGCVDFVLPPDGIAQELVRISRHPYLRVPAQTAAPEGGESSSLAEIFHILRSATSVDFSFYKPGTIGRRIFRRMALHRLENLDQYATFLREHREEVDALFQDLLINVTSFFRDPSTFDALRALVYPALFHDRARDDTIRVWVPGCSTGEEVYSVAISLLEYMQEQKVSIPVQIFGTDLSELALERARAGVYPESISADLSAARLRNFFTKNNSVYQISRAVRDLCIFARQNVTKDPPFSHLDLITCRNLMIYLAPVLQNKVLRLFHYALKPSGYLVLGLSESIGASAELFHTFDKAQRIYRPRPAPANLPLDLDTYEERGEARPAGAEHKPVDSGRELQKHVDQILLSRYAPPSVLVNRELRVLQFRGRTSPYLEHTAGEASLDLMKLCPGGAGLKIRDLIRRVERTLLPVQSDVVPISTSDGVRRVRVGVTPVQVAGSPDHEFLVVFEETPKPARAAKGEKKLAPAEGTKRVDELEQELGATRQYLQAVIEEQEAATEELKSANEEIQSSNEELQSTNEELLTAKEELQSTNEELTTVNEEMQSRNEELSQVNNDLINLLSSVNIPIVMVGGDLRIRRFTPQAERILNLLPTDVGRPLGDFKLKIEVADLEKMVTEVIDTLHTREREVQDHQGRLYSMSIRPYRTSENKIDGAVLTLIDLTHRRQAAEERYRRLFESAQDAILIVDTGTGEVLDVNPFASRLFGYPRESMVGARYWEARAFRDSALNEASLRELSDHDVVRRSLTLTNAAGDLVELELLATAFKEGQRRASQLTFRDITLRRQLEDRMRRSDEEWQQAQKLEAVGRLAGNMAHELNRHLSAVMSQCEPGAESVPPDLEQMRASLRQAISLTRQLLAFGGRQPAHPEVFAINEVVHDLEQMLQAVLKPDTSLVLATEAPSGRVHADRAAIEQVILSLVLSARDAMPNGGQIRVETTNMDVDEAFSHQHPSVTPGRYVTFSICDTAGDMASTARTRLFEAVAGKGKEMGAGMGLPAIYETIKQGGGAIWAYSELGVGTTFRVFLPRVNGNDAQ